MGLDASSIGSPSILRAVRERQRACGLVDDAHYLAFVRSQAVEMQALVESLVVNETWFFREREALSTLAVIAQERSRSLPQASDLKVLSLPCSTGEEPYSIVMTLLDAGLMATSFQVDGVDISAHALKLARQAVFGSNSFRGTDLAFRQCYFTLSEGHYGLHDHIKSVVNFQQGNLFSPNFLPGSGTYDIIFCRNVMIYFDDLMKNRAIEVLHRLLSKDGYLFVGSAEGGLLPARGFVSVRFPSGIAFQKMTAATVAHRAVAADHKVVRPKTRPAVLQPAPKTLPVALGLPSATPLARRPQMTSPVSLDHVSLLADQGKLQQAKQLCEQHLEAHGPTAQALYLMGLMQDAVGEPLAAIDYYRKALYLDSQHPQALVHLASVLERQGDAGAAALLRARFERSIVKRSSL